MRWECREVSFLLSKLSWDRLGIWLTTKAKFCILLFLLPTIHSTRCSDMQAQRQSCPPFGATCFWAGRPFWQIGLLQMLSFSKWMVGLVMMTRDFDVKLFLLIWMSCMSFFIIFCVCHWTATLFPNCVLHSHCLDLRGTRNSSWSATWVHFPTRWVWMPVWMLQSNKLYFLLLIH